jgi:hypothetical protein
MVIPVPADLQAGEHQVVVVIDETPTQTNGQRPVLNLSAHSVGLVDERFTFRREDLYDGG